MEKKRQIAFIFIFLIWVIALLYSFYYIHSIYKSITNPAPIPQDMLDEKSVELYSVISISNSDLSSGQYKTLKEGDVVHTEIKGDDYSFKIYNIDTDNQDLEGVVNNFLYFKIRASQGKKFDINGDSYYDILVSVKDISENQADIYFESITEKISVRGYMGELMNKIERNYDLQSKLLIFLFLLAFVIFLFLVMKFHIYPRLKIKKFTAQETPSGAFSALYSEFNIAKKAGNKSKAKRIYKRAKHLHDYMSNKEKKSYSSKVSRMEKYIR